MWKVVIVDDEDHAISRLTRLLSDRDHRFETIECCNTVDQAIRSIEKIEPNLVFLDIALGDRTGFDLLKAIPSIDFDIIFTTAHNNYAVEAFEYSAIHYLLKPVTPESLTEALERFNDKLDKQKTNNRLENLLYNLEMRATIDKKIAVPGVNGMLFLKVGEILRMEADGNYTHIHLCSGEKFLILKRLKYYEELLDQRSFIRVHQSHLVHLAYVEKYVRGKKAYLLMSSGEEVPVSIRKKEAFMDQLSKNKQM